MPSPHDRDRQTIRRQTAPGSPGYLRRHDPPKSVDVDPESLSPEARAVAEWLDRKRCQHRHGFRDPRVIDLPSGARAASGQCLACGAVRFLGRDGSVVERIEDVAVDHAPTLTARSA